MSIDKLLYSLLVMLGPKKFESYPDYKSWSTKEKEFYKKLPSKLKKDYRKLKELREIYMLVREEEIITFTLDYFRNILKTSHQQSSTEIENEEEICS